MSSKKYGWTGMKRVSVSLSFDYYFVLMAGQSRQDCRPTRRYVISLTPPQNQTPLEVPPSVRSDSVFLMSGTVAPSRVLPRPHHMSPPMTL